MNTFIEKLSDCLREKNFVKLTFSKPTKKAEDLKNVYVRLVEIKGKEKLIP